MGTGACVAAPTTPFMVTPVLLAVRKRLSKHISAPEFAPEELKSHTLCWSTAVFLGTWIHDQLPELLATTEPALWPITLARDVQPCVASLRMYVRLTLQRTCVSSKRALIHGGENRDVN